MLSICKSFAAEYNITFNAKKTMCIKFGSPVTDYDKVYLDGNLIKWVERIKHLGNTVNVKLNDVNDCDSKRCLFNASVNKLLGNYGGVQTNILCKLFRSYCCSFYGSQLWDLNSNGFRSCCIQWNKAVRKLFRLPYRTHTWLLGPLIDQPHISIQLTVKTLRFIDCMLHSSNNIVSHIGNIAKCCANSPVGRNIAYMKYKYDINFDDKLSANVARVRNAQNCTLYQQALVYNMKNLINVKNCVYTLECFDADMVDSMLYNIACE